MKKLLERYRGIPVTVRASVWYTICSIIQKSIAFLTIPIFTKMLTTQEYGQFSVYQSWLNIIMIFVTLSLYGGVFNNAMLKYEHDRMGFVASMQGLVFCMCAAWFVIYYIAHDFWNDILNLSTGLVVLMFLEMAIQPSMNFWSGKQRYEYKYKNFVIVTLILAAANPLTGIFAVAAAEERGTARIVSNAFVIIVVSGALCIYNFVKGKTFFVKEYWKYALAFNIPLVPYYISQMLFTQSDRIMISKMVGNDKAGIYSLALNCSTVVLFVLTAIESSFVPWLYRKIKNEEYKDVAKVGNELLVLTGAALICVTLIGPEIVWIMAPSEYQEAIWTIPPVVGGLLFLFETKLFVGVEFYYEHKSGLVLASITSACVNVALNYILIPKVGFIVAGYTTLAAYMIFAVMNYISMQKIQRKLLEKGVMQKIYDGKFMVKFSVIYMLISFGILLLYPYRLVRIALIAAVAAAIAVKYKTIVEKIELLRS